MLIFISKTILYLTHFSLNYLLISEDRNKVSILLHSYWCDISALVSILKIFGPIRPPLTQSQNAQSLHKSQYTK